MRYFLVTMLLAFGIFLLSPLQSRGVTGRKKAGG